MATVQHGNGVESSNAPNCNLQHESVFAASAAQGVTYTLIGETAEPQADVDQVIVVDCSVPALNSVLKYTGVWAGNANGVNAVDGEQEYPTCTTDFAALAAAASAGSNVAEMFTALDNSGSNTVLFTDDSGDATLWTMQSYFMNPASYPFNYNATSTNNVDAALLNSIPAESVKKVENKSLVVDALSAIVAPATSDGINALELFKQADAAGKIPGVAPASAGTVGSTAFIAGDSITIYVDYTLTKTKTFSLDAASGEAAKFTINGETVAIVAEDTLSASKTVRIGWQFKASA